MSRAMSYRFYDVLNDSGGEVDQMAGGIDVGFHNRADGVDERLARVHEILADGGGSLDDKVSGILERAA